MATKYWAAVLFFWAILAPLSWGVYDARLVLRTSCRIGAPNGGRVYGSGSGNVVANNGHECVVYTAAHVLEGARWIEVTPWQHDLTYKAKLLAIDRNSDAAILTFSHSGGYSVSPPEIQEDVTPGELLYGYGYGGRQPGQPPREMRAQVKAKRDFAGRVLTSHYSRSGDSGSVMYSAITGKAVAVTHGFNPYGGLAVPVEAFQTQITRGRLLSGFFRGGGG